MSKEEQRSTTESHVQVLEERRVTKALAPHNAPNAAFQDVRATIASLHTKVTVSIFLFQSELIISINRFSNYMVGQELKSSLLLFVRIRSHTTCRFTLPQVIALKASSAQSRIVLR